MTLRFLHERLFVRRGLGRLVMFLARVVPPLQELPVEMADGRILFLDLREVMCMPYLLEGRIWEEAGETALVRGVLQQGDVAVDIGANVGWYSDLMARLVGESGRVIAVDPHPVAGRLLARTLAAYAQCELRTVALSDHEGVADLRIPADGGMSSLGPLPRATRIQPCRCEHWTTFSPN